jgi:hypothetical protein
MAMVGKETRHRQAIDDAPQARVLDGGEIDLALLARLGGIHLPQRHRVALDDFGQCMHQGLGKMISRGKPIGAFEEYR